MAMQHSDQRGSATFFRIIVLRNVLCPNQDSSVITLIDWWSHADGEAVGTLSVIVIFKSVTASGERWSGSGRLSMQRAADTCNV